MRLARLWQLPVSNLATRFSLDLSALTTTMGMTIPEVGAANRALLSQEFQIQTTASGWLGFQITPKGLALWLQEVVQIHRYPITITPWAPNAEEIWSVQYTHARCCALLQLAQQEGLLSRHPGTSGINALPDPQPFSWLTATGTFRLTTPASTTLLGTLMDWLDDSACGPRGANPARAMWQQTLRLSQAWQRCYQTQAPWCAKTPDPLLQQARLGLVLITQRCLRSALEQWLCQTAPVAL